MISVKVPTFYLNLFCSHIQHPSFLKNFEHVSNKKNGDCSTATSSIRGPKCGVPWHVLVALQSLETSVCLVTVKEPLLTLSLNVPEKAEPQIHPKTNSQDNPS